MSFPIAMSRILSEVGQVAAEVPCKIEGYREFVSLYSGRRLQILNVDNRFPYFSEVEILYRVIRFRIKSELVDKNVGIEDLADLQEMRFAREDLVEMIMAMWQVPLDTLISPRFVDIPV